MAIPLVLTWRIAGERHALTVWLGLVAMLIATMCLPLRRQVTIGLLLGIGAGLGTLFAGNTLALLLLIVAASLAQWRFNQWSITVGAMIPPIVFAYWDGAERTAVDVVMGTWLGAGLAIAIVALARVHGASRPARPRDALYHAIALAVGCAAMVGLIVALDLPKGFWGILTICLVFRPTWDETTITVRYRVLGTAIGGAATVAIGTVAPTPIVMVLALVSGWLAVAFTLSHDYFRYVVFFTFALLLTFSVRQPLLGLAAERVGMTFLGGLFAIALTAIITRQTRPTTEPVGPEEPS